MLCRYGVWECQGVLVGLAPYQAGQLNALRGQNDVWALRGWSLSYRADTWERNVSKGLLHGTGQAHQLLQFCSAATVSAAVTRYKLDWVPGVPAV